MDYLNTVDTSLKIFIDSSRKKMFRTTYIMSIIILGRRRESISLPSSLQQVTLVFLQSAKRVKLKKNPKTFITKSGIHNLRIQIKN